MPKYFGYGRSGVLEWCCDPPKVEAHDTGSPTFKITHWRWRNDDGVEGSGGGTATFIKAEDTAITVGPSQDVEFDTNVRLRLIVEEENGGDPGNRTFLAMFKLNGGSAANIGSGFFVTAALSTHFVDNDATTNHGLTAPAGTFVAGEILEGLTSMVTGDIDLAQAGWTIVEFVCQFKDADLADTDTLEFGVREDVGPTELFPGVTMATVGDAGVATVYPPWPRTQRTTVRM